MTDLIKRLRDTASKGVSVWGDLQMEAAAEIERLREALADIVFHVDEAMRNEVQPYEVEKAFERASKALGVKHD